MNFPHRIRTIYFKELIDILRDRRTLIAMIVVPIVLYPLLMLGSVQAVSYQHESLEQEVLVIGVAAESHRIMLSQLIRLDAAALAREKARFDPEDDVVRDLPKPLDDAKIQVFDSIDHLQRAIRERQVPVGIVFNGNTLVDSIEQQVNVHVHADYEEPRGTTAGRRVEELLLRTNKRMQDARLNERQLPKSFLEPYTIESVDLSAPSSILGEILPLILILMTITGAIYPAIDLTAGERERGTLESLMACPVPVIDLIVGKFLVVTTVAILGAALNLGSVTATVYFGGFDKVIASTGGQVPIAKMLFILAALIPFAVLMSAIMIAVCSYARTFKEAQNYVTPVILAVLIPGGIAALPATRLEGMMLVMPVGNMVLLAKELLLGAAVGPWEVVMVLLSTSFYAGAAVAVAANIFGRESVVFADAGSLRGTFSRIMMKPSLRPSVSMSLLVTALLFPTWFFVQSAVSPATDESAVGLLYSTAWLMPLLFLVLPLVLLSYFKVDIANTLAMKMPQGWHMAAAVLIGLSAWVPAHEINVVQGSLLGMPPSVAQSAERLAEAIKLIPPSTAWLLLALLPAVCEEILFRGFLLSGLRASNGKWPAILASAAIFGVFHFFVFRFAVTAGLGVILGYLCWQSRSILPAMVAHALHNTLGVLSVIKPEWQRWIGLPNDPDASSQWAHLPLWLILVGSAVMLYGLYLASRPYYGTGVWGTEQGVRLKNPEP